MTTALPTGLTNELLARARELAGRAYAPYSRYAVGAAVLTASGEIVGGCNVENASYGLSICAERSAVFTARGRGLVDPRDVPLVAIAIAAQGGPPPWPCGACRQVLAEFARADAAVLVAAGETVHVAKLAELLPHAFQFERKG